MADDFVRPNGIAFSSDERHLYLVRHSRATTSAAFGVVDDASLTAGEVFARCDSGSSTDCGSTDLVVSGLRLTMDCTASTQTALCSGNSTFPRSCLNLTFGGRKGNDLFITATSSLYAVRPHVTGVRYPASQRPSPILPTVFDRARSRPRLGMCGNARGPKLDPSWFLTGLKRIPR